MIQNETVNRWETIITGALMLSQVIVIALLLFFHTPDSPAVVAQSKAMERIATNLDDIKQTLQHTGGK